MRWILAALVPVVAVLAVVMTVGDGDPVAVDAQSAHVAAVVAAGGIVDSIHPVDEHVRRFQGTVTERPDTLRRASDSFDALIQRWVVAVQHYDTTALNAMALDRPEFAWLYYPTSHLSKPPYEAPPELLWGQILTSSDDGARKALRKFGGRSFALTSVRCAAESSVEGNNRLHSDCRGTVVTGTDTLRNVRMFGTVIERDSRFKFIGHSNSL